MRTLIHHNHILLSLLLAAGCLLFQVSLASANEQNTADTLAKKYVALKSNGMFFKNNYGDEFIVTSSIKEGDANGEVYAKINHPIETIRAMLQSLSQWCDAATLHINVHDCRAEPDTNSVVMTVGKDSILPISNQYTFEYTVHYVQLHKDYLQIYFDAKDGPLDTSDYFLKLEAVTLNDSNSFVHLVYANHFGFMSRVLLKTYLNTAGREKVGFSMIDDHNSDQPEFIKGIEGIMERNVMRYLFALQAYMDCRQAPAQERLAQGGRLWYQYIEKYPAQLHEVSLDQYLEQKLSVAQH